ncbi:hypothetical protein GCM10019059_06540 [Camelimonas fluminis]|nr:hypothetical protein GCM10019059_06540 [Camelimonas fluminis]
MRQHLAWPALERLAYNRDLPRVRALLRWRDLMCPDRPPVAGNDNDPDLAIDTIMGVRPTEAELLTAAGMVQDGRAWSNTYRKPMPAYRPTTARLVRDGAKLRLGGLVFREGWLESYESPTGRKFRPGERYGKPKGPAPRGRTDESIAWYLGLRGTVSEPQGVRRPFSNAPAPSGRHFWPVSETKELRRSLLAWLGVDGRTPFHAARENAGLLESDAASDSIAPGAYWFGGVSHGRGTGEASVGASQDRTVDDADTAIDLARVRRLLGDDADTLDMAVSPANAASIAEARGYSSSTAKKVGAAVTERALDAFMAVEKKLAA